ncbi:hypothetical protein EK904_014862 [Melospiza melodia maxima]|nr:hypothetical protein EK904_014862 [Melospiza melodia maxima]
MKVCSAPPRSKDNADYPVLSKWFCWLKSGGFRRYDNALSCKILGPWESPIGVIKRKFSETYCANHTYLKLLL